MHNAAGSNVEKLDDRLMTPDELAAYLGISKGAVYHLNHRGGGPAYFKLGTVVRYSRADVEAWLSSKKHQPQPH